MNLSQQASACEAAARILGGGLKPSASEKQHLVTLLKGAAVTLRNAEYEARR